MPLPNLSSDEVVDKLQQKMKKIKDDDIERDISQKAQILGIPYIDLTSLSIGTESISVISEEEAMELGAVCFFYNGEEFRMGVYNEKNLDKIKELFEKLKEKLHANGIMYIISKRSFDKACAVYKSIPKIKKIIQGVEITGEDIDKFKKEIKDFSELQNKIKEVSITDLITLIIASALNSRSSDIHIEAEKDAIKARFRIDGILYDVAVIEKENWQKIISRIKLISKLKLNIGNKPQDGRFTIFLDGNDIDVRVSTLPTAYGESVVMRILKSDITRLSFEKLGFRKKAFSELSREIKKPNGMIITTGPTGSGKTTTLYAILNELNSPDMKIITMEDPIEYKLKGVNQSQIDKAKDYTFAKGLKSILRQDPDIVMVGEIRDSETADIAINAALTGHLVISTIHTNSAFGAIPRFMAIDAKPYLLAPALNVVIGQRLVRRVCPDCKKEYSLTIEQKEEVKKVLSEIPGNSEEEIVNIEEIKFYKGEGCEKCQNLGYKGRVGIYEVMTMNNELKQAIIDAKDISEYSIQKTARKQGMLTMREDGVLKAMDGITTIDEIFRVTK